MSSPDVFNATTNATSASPHIIVDDQSDVLKVSEGALIGLIGGFAALIMVLIGVAILLLYCRSKRGSPTFGQSFIGRWCCCCRCMWESQVHTTTSLYRRRKRSQGSDSQYAGVGEELYGPRELECEEELVWMPGRGLSSRRMSASDAVEPPMPSVGTFSQSGNDSSGLGSRSSAFPVSVDSFNADACQRGDVLPQIHDHTTQELVGRVVVPGPADATALWADDQLKHIGTHTD